MTDEKKPPRATITFRLSPTVTQWIDDLAATENRTRSQMLRVLVSEAITARTKR